MMRHETYDLVLFLSMRVLRKLDWSKLYSIESRIKDNQKDSYKIFFSINILLFSLSLSRDDDGEELIEYPMILVHVRQMRSNSGGYAGFRGRTPTPGTAT